MRVRNPESGWCREGKPTQRSPEFVSPEGREPQGRCCWILHATRIRRLTSALCAKPLLRRPGSARHSLRRAPNRSSATVIWAPWGSIEAGSRRVAPSGVTSRHPPRDTCFGRSRTAVARAGHSWPTRAAVGQSVVPATRPSTGRAPNDFGHSSLGNRCMTSLPLRWVERHDVPLTSVSRTSRRPSRFGESNATVSFSLR